MLVEIAFALVSAATAAAIAWWARGRVRGELEEPRGSQAALQQQGLACGLELWDPHSCLNAINRSILSAPEPLLDDHPLYLVADHLKLLAQISRADGWATGVQVCEWLRVVIALQQSNGSAAVSVSLPPTLAQLHMPALGRALWPKLRHAGAIESVWLQATRVDDDAAAPCQLQLRMVYRPAQAEDGAGAGQMAWQENVTTAWRRAAPSRTSRQ